MEALTWKHRVNTINVNSLQFYTEILLPMSFCMDKFYFRYLEAFWSFIISLIEDCEDNYV